MNKKMMNNKAEMTEAMIKENTMNRMNAIIKICKRTNCHVNWSYFEKECEKYGWDIEMFKAMWN